MTRVQMSPMLVLVLDQRPLQLTEVGHCAKQDFFTHLQDFISLALLLKI